MDTFTLSRNFFNWTFENPEKVSPNHVALFFYCIDLNNRVGGKDKFGLPSGIAMEAIGIKSYNTYIKTLNGLVEWGFIIMVEKCKNQYSANIVALSEFDKALDKALDKATIKHVIKQSESTCESIYTIDKQVNKETSKQRNNDSPSEPEASDGGDVVCDDKFKTLQAWMSTNASSVLKMSEQLTNDEYKKLGEKGFTGKELAGLLRAMDNYKPLLKKNKSVYKTLLNWKRMQDERKSQSKINNTDSNGFVKPQEIAV